RVVCALEAVDQRSTCDGNFAAMVFDLGVGAINLWGYVKIYFDHIARIPKPFDMQPSAFARIKTGSGRFVLCSRRRDRDQISITSNVSRLGVQPAWQA